MSTLQRTETACGTVWRRAPARQPLRPPLLLLHGGAGSWRHWTRNVDALSAGRDVWLPDLPGMGESADAPAPRDHEAIAQVLAQDIDELMPGAEVLDVAGFSFGGIVAGFLAGLRPARVGALVLVGAGGLGLRRRDERILRPWKHLRDAQARADAHRFNLATLMLSKPDRIDAATLQIYAEDVSRTRVNSARSSRTAALKERIPALHVPVHGIWGRLDVTAHAKFDEIRAILRTGRENAELCVIDDAGHWVQYEQAAVFNAELQRLLEAPR